MLDYFRQPFSVSLNNKRKAPFCFLYVVLTDLSFSPTTLVAIIIQNIMGLCVFGFHRTAVICRAISSPSAWNALKNVYGTHHLPVRRFVFGLQWVSADSLTCYVELIIEQEEGGFPFSTVTRPEYCSCLCLSSVICSRCSPQIRSFQEVPSSLEHV